VPAEREDVRGTVTTAPREATLAAHLPDSVHVGSANAASEPEVPVMSAGVDTAETRLHASDAAPGMPSETDRGDITAPPVFQASAPPGADEEADRLPAGASAPPGKASARQPVRSSAPRVHEPIARYEATAGETSTSPTRPESAILPAARARGRAESKTDGAVPAGTDEADPNAPSAVPPPTRIEGAPRQETPKAAAPIHDPEQLTRLHELHTAAREGGTIRLELIDDRLGPVEVRVGVRADAVHASVYASHDSARAALADHRPLLEAALERAHLRLEGFSVGLGHHGQGQAPGSDEPWPRGFVAPLEAPTNAIEPTTVIGGLTVRA